MKKESMKEPDPVNVPHARNSTALRKQDQGVSALRYGGLTSLETIDLFLTTGTVKAM